MEKYDMEKYNERECDYDGKRAEELFKDKTVEQLDEEWEEFKANFYAEHGSSDCSLENR